MRTYKSESTSATIEERNGAFIVSVETTRRFVGSYGEGISWLTERYGEYFVRVRDHRTIES